MLDYTAHRLPETGKKLSRCKVVKKKKRKILASLTLQTGVPFLLVEKHLHTQLAVFWKGIAIMELKIKGNQKSVQHLFHH